MYFLLLQLISSDGIQTSDHFNVRPEEAIESGPRPQARPEKEFLAEQQQQLGRLLRHVRKQPGLELDLDVSDDGDDRGG